MCDPVTITILTVMAVAGGTKAYGQYQAAKSQSEMYKYQSALALQEVTRRRALAAQEKQAIKDAELANISATQDVASQQAKMLARTAATVSGAQRATVGALGLGGGTTAEDIAVSGFDKATMDQMAVRYNANAKSWMLKEQSKQERWRISEDTKSKAWSLQSEAKQYDYASKWSRYTGKIAVTQTLLETAGSMALVGAGATKPTTGGGVGGGGHAGSSSGSTQTRFVA